MTPRWARGPKVHAYDTSLTEGKRFREFQVAHATANLQVVEAADSRRQSLFTSSVGALAHVKSVENTAR